MSLAGAITREDVKTLTLGTNTDFMEEAAKVTSLYKAKLDSPKRIQATQDHRMDVDIEPRGEDLA
jgi:hypothetical protein